MALTNNILAQLAMPAGVETVLFGVPATNNAQIEELSFCNTGGATSSFRLAFCPLGVVNHPADWIYFDLPLAANNTFGVHLNLELGPTDSIRVFSALGSISVTLLGTLV